MSATPHLYYFNPNTYSTEWFVAAYSREEAIAAVEKYIRDENASDDYSWYTRGDPEELRARDLAENLRWLKCYVDETSDDDVLPPRIEEYPIGHVVQTEIS